MVESSVDEGGGEAKTFPVGVFLPEVFGVPRAAPGKTVASEDAESPLVGEGGGVEVAF